MTEQEEAEIKQDISKHELLRDAAWRAFHYHDGMAFRLKCKLNALSPERCAEISKLIGSNLPDYKEVGE